MSITFNEQLQRNIDTDYEDELELVEEQAKAEGNPAPYAFYNDKGKIYVF